MASRWCGLQLRCQGNVDMLRLMATRSENTLGDFLKDRRARLDPVLFGFGSTRRRTPGLRREEVAQRANVSVTWYTWLEQGRQGTPSADVLERLSCALELTTTEREHMFLIAQQRPPAARPDLRSEVTRRMQRTIDSFESSPAFIKSAAWDVLAWNRAATVVLTDYSKLAPVDRNILKLLFRNPEIRAQNPYWESQARAAVATFRLQTARAGGIQFAQAMLDEMCSTSPEFAALWGANDVDAYEGVKHIEHSIVGRLALEYSSYTVDGRPDLSLLIYTPATTEDMTKVRALLV